MGPVMRGSFCHGKTKTASTQANRHEHADEKEADLDTSRGSRGHPAVRFRLPAHDARRTRDPSHQRLLHLMRRDHVGAAAPEAASAPDEALRRVLRGFVIALVVLLAAGCGAPQLGPSKGEGRLVLRDFLEKGTTERTGYGAYSYVLLPRPPSSDERYLALLRAYATLPPDDPAAPEVPVTRRNLTYAPVDATPPPAPDAEWLIQRYDTSRAAMLLHSQNLQDAGPYIVTFTSPLSFQRAPVDLAVLDLTDAPAQSMKPWLEYFVRATQAPDDWGQRKAERMLLNIHDFLADVGGAFDLTVKGIEPAGKLMKPFSSKL
jgi:hypothetical protein